MKRFRTWLTALMTATALALTGCGDDSVPDPVRDAGYETLRANLEQQLTRLGFTNVTVAIETETDKVKVTASPTPAATRATGKPNPSTSAKPKVTGKQSAAPTATTVSYKILSATFDIPGLNCRGNVEQILHGLPLDPPYFDEVIMPGGTEVEVEGESRDTVTLPKIFEYVFVTLPQCRQPGVTAPPVAPSVSASAGPQG